MEVTAPYTEHLWVNVRINAWLNYPLPVEHEAGVWVGLKSRLVTDHFRIVPLSDRLVLNSELDRVCIDVISEHMREEVVVSLRVSNMRHI